MLFGYQYEKKVLDDAMRFAEENDMKLLYGAMVGGISKGLQNFDSDYDTRFLYIKKDFPQKMYEPEKCKESALIKRYYPEEDELYEWIPFWELTSFFSYLENPILDGKFSIGLFGVVLWTMMSPYVWDPYGLQNKLVPYINTFFSKYYAVKYYLMQIENQMSMGNEKQILLKRYLYAVHAACSIEWVINNATMPPVYLRTLYLVAQNDNVEKEIEKLIATMHGEADKLLGVSKEIKQMHQTHATILTSKNEILEDYINRVRIQGEEFLLNYSQDDNKCKSNIMQIISLVDQSLHEKEVNGIKQW